MPDLTEKLKLKKPRLNEAADIQVINENMDIIDAIMNSNKANYLALLQRIEKAEENLNKKIDKNCSPQFFLPANGWDENKQQTLPCDRFTVGSTIIPAYIMPESNIDACSKAGISIHSNTDTTITFSCSNIPSIDVVVGAMYQGESDVRYEILDEKGVKEITWEETVEHINHDYIVLCDFEKEPSTSGAWYPDVVNNLFFTNVSSAYHSQVDSDVFLGSKALQVTQNQSPSGTYDFNKYLENKFQIDCIIKCDKAYNNYNRYLMQLISVSSIVENSSRTNYFRIAYERNNLVFKIGTESGTKIKTIDLNVPFHICIQADRIANTAKVYIDAELMGTYNCNFLRTSAEVDLAYTCDTVTVTYDELRIKNGWDTTVKNHLLDTEPYKYQWTETVKRSAVVKVIENTILRYNQNGTVDKYDDVRAPFEVNTNTVALLHCDNLATVDEKGNVVTIKDGSVTLDIENKMIGAACYKFDGTTTRPLTITVPSNIFKTANNELFSFYFKIKDFNTTAKYKLAEIYNDSEVGFSIYIENDILHASYLNGEFDFTINTITRLLGEIIDINDLAMMNDVLYYFVFGIEKSTASNLTGSRIKGCLSVYSSIKNIANYQNMNSTLGSISDFGNYTKISLGEFVGCVDEIRLENSVYTKDENYRKEWVKL